MEWKWFLYGLTSSDPSPSPAPSPALSPALSPILSPAPTLILGRIAGKTYSESAASFSFQYLFFISLVQLMNMEFYI